ncbi:pancreatic lipase-related protein 2-like [Anticarsia gemmatalis]|uniref:pancreatic lipase-related protein 2-like n=1 Tax=Anticarsia gemmatalis TaxID=129554 RepID=UPI003F770E22
MILRQLITHIGFLVVHINALPYENEYGPEYGDEWILFYDDEGNTHVMNFSTIPSDSRGMIFGDAYYYLYTRDNVDPEELFLPTEENQVFSSQYFNSSNALKVVTHGWFSSEQTTWIQQIKDEFLLKDDYNVITIDWSEIASNPIYPWAAFSTRYIGKKIAKLLDAITLSYQVDGSNMHLLGHSLGSQIMAYTASYSNQRIQRITGLDPARPFFELPMMPQECRLDKTDAVFVDIIHTCGGIYGYRKSHGHADFYPNNGKAKQPGCEGFQNVIEGCSHGRACLFFRESINSEISFTAYPCENWEKFKSGECRQNFTYMGYQATEGDFGDYYLYTKDESPYALGDH